MPWYWTMVIVTRRLRHERDVTRAEAALPEAPATRRPPAPRHFPYS
jgi:hypothetical protein